MMDIPPSEPPPPPRLSVIIPAFNEARRLPGNLRRVAEHCAGLFSADPAGYEVLAIVERSGDDTLARCRAEAASLGPQVAVIDNGPQRGKGHAVRCGMLRARGAIRFFTDADLSTPPEEIGRFLAHLDAYPETDVLIGDRRQAGATPGRRQGPVRHTLGGFYSAAARALAGGGRRAGGRPLPAGLADTQCGFKAFRATAAREIFARQRMDGFAFDVETLLLAARLGFRVEALPVQGWTDAPDSTLRIARDGAQMLWDLARVRGLVARSLRERPPSPATAEGSDGKPAVGPRP